MMNRRTIAVLAMIVAASALAGCITRVSTGGGGASTGTSTTAPGTETTAPTGEAQATLTATLTPVNDSGVSGVATVTVSGSTLNVTINATGLVPNQQHNQYINSPSEGVATCPPSPTTSGTVVNESQAEQFYGAILAALTPFPTADANGDISYSQTVSISGATPVSLAGRATVLHGLNVNGKYDGGPPVACGTLVPATPSGGGTEGSGTSGGGAGETGGSSGTTGSTTSTTTTGTTGGGTGGGGGGTTTFAPPPGGIEVPSEGPAKP